MGGSARSSSLRLASHRPPGMFVPAMTRFRPCIDLHQGKVKQIVGGSLRDEGAGPVENFV